MKIFDFWNKLMLPHKSGSLYARKYSDNIYIGRNNELDFRLFLTNTLEKSTDFNDYRYINSKYFKNISLEGVLFDNVYFFEIKNEIGLLNGKEDFNCLFQFVLGKEIGGLGQGWGTGRQSRGCNNS